jgi:hypothetical protein
MAISHADGGLKVVWSHWSKPSARGGIQRWLTEKHHLLSWILSFEQARQHYAETCLVTDDAGARLLVDELGLAFEHVSTELNALDGHNPDWWALGKLYAYRLQERPFVHIDNDVFLWKALPESLARADVIAQSPEPFNSFCYRPEKVEHALRHLAQSWLPEEWVWYRRAGVAQRGDCCGIFGGTRNDFIRYYSDLAIRFVSDPANQQGWARLADKFGNMVLLEQYLLTACIEYHHACETSPFAGISIQHLFESCADIYNPERVIEAGYTHLLGDAKKNSIVADRLEERVRHDYPTQYERCLALLDDAPRQDRRAS